MTNFGTCNVRLLSQMPFQQSFGKKERHTRTHDRWYINMAFIPKGNHSQTHANQSFTVRSSHSRTSSIQLSIMLFKSYGTILLFFVAMASIGAALHVAKRQTDVNCCYSCDDDPACQVTLGGKNLTSQCHC